MRRQLSAMTWRPVLLASDEGFEDGSAALGVLLWAGIGAGIGAGVDALVQKRQIIYERRPPQTARISLIPIASSHRKGALVSVRF